MAAFTRKPQARGSLDRRIVFPKEVPTREIVRKRVPLTNVHNPFKIRIVIHRDENKKCSYSIKASVDTWTSKTKFFFLETKHIELRNLTKLLKIRLQIGPNYLPSISTL